jgi:hypothetical protein
MPVDKKIYFFWGNEKMSWMRYMTLYSFRKLNPSWEIILYKAKQKHWQKTWKTNNYQDFFCYNGADYFKKIQSLDIKIEQYKETDITPSQISNFFKWEILSKNSGVYADMDILWFKPIDSFYEKVREFDTAICQTQYVSIGLLASSGHNNFFQDLYRNAFKCYNGEYYQTAGIENVYNFLDCVYRHEEVLNKARAKYTGLNFYNIPMDLIYPFDSKRIEEAFSSPCEIKDLPDETIGYHWYAARRVSQSFNNILTEDNYKEHNTLFSKIIPMIL